MTSLRIRGEATMIRPAEERDADLLVGWHDDPEVARYWDHERFTSTEMLARLRRAEVDAFVVEADGEPVGYLQVWSEGAAGGIDMFLTKLRHFRHGLIIAQWI